jgi:LysR family transcriptional regulator, regulator of abg operon
MKLHQLRQLIAVADSGSLRSAARQLNIAQSAITKSIQLLERELDVPLFERHKRGVAVTRTGALFVQRARVAVSELSRAQEEVEQLRGSGTGRVTISLSTVPHIALLPKVISPFYRKYPEVSLTVVEALGFASIEPQMRNGLLDAYIGVEPGSRLSAEYQVESLFENRRRVIARAGHPLASARSLGQLSDARWLLASANYAPTLVSFFKRNRCEMPRHLTFASSILSQVILLLNSDLVMIGPKQLVESPLYKGRLAAIPIREEIDAPSIVMVRRAASPLTPAAEHFCDLMRRAATPLRAVT